MTVSITDQPHTDRILEEAIAAHRNGDIDGAYGVYRQILTDQPDHAGARHMVGVVHLQQGRVVDAENEIRRAIATDSGVARYHQNLAVALTGQNRIEEALAALETALNVDPVNREAAFATAGLLLQVARPVKAEGILRDLVATDPGDAAALANLAAALNMQNRAAESAEVCRQAVEQHPQEANLWINLATALELLNNLDAAAEAAERALALQPESAMAQVMTARIARRRGTATEAYDRLLPMLELSLSDADEISVRNELALTLDDLKKPREAFAEFAARNVARAATSEARRYDGGRFLDRVTRNRRWFDKETINRLMALSPVDAGRGLIFFVGFPRSGTTLMEQVLMTHPGVITTEEASPITVVLRAASSQGMDTVGYPECLATLDEAGVETLRKVYLDQVEQVVGEREGKVIVDKLPLNIVELGLINILFPAARIVVALRDPRDVCLSCFIQRFRLNDPMVNFLDLKATGRTYVEVMTLWLHYRAVLSAPVLTYRYEDLVSDFDGTVRQVLEFIGVGWDEAIRGYRDAAARRGIRTPSYHAVVAPVNNRAIGRWRSYANDLVPILEPFVETFGYAEEN